MHPDTLHLGRIFSEPAKNRLKRKIFKPFFFASVLVNMIIMRLKLSEILKNISTHQLFIFLLAANV